MVNLNQVQDYLNQHSTELERQQVSLMINEVNTITFNAYHNKREVCFIGLITLFLPDIIDTSLKNLKPIPKCAFLLLCAYAGAKLLDRFFSVPIPEIALNIQLNSDNHQQTMADIITTLQQTCVQMKKNNSNMQTAKWGSLSLNGFFEVCIHTFFPSLNYHSKMPLRMIQACANLKYTEQFTKFL